MPRRRRRTKRNSDHQEKVLILREVDRTLAGLVSVLVMMPLTVIGIMGGIAVVENYPSLHGWEAGVAAVGGVLGAGIGFPLGWGIYFLLPRPCRIAVQILALLTMRPPRREKWYHKRKQSLGQSIRELMALRREMEAAEASASDRRKQAASRKTSNTTSGDG